MKEQIFKHFSHILDELISEYNFFQYYFQCPYSIDEDILGEYEGGIFANYSLDMRFGASRGCIIDNCYDYVVKFDFPDQIEYASCDEELGIYEMAESLGFEKYLARPIYLGNYKKTIHTYTHRDVTDNIIDFYGFNEEEFSDKLQMAVDNWDLEQEEITIEIPLYAYPRAEKYKFPKVESEESSRFIASHSDTSPLLERSTAVAMAFVKEYGEEEFEKFSEFLYERNINDLHTSNIMKIGDHLVLTDYCGFHSNY